MNEEKKFTDQEKLSYISKAFVIWSQAEITDNLDVFDGAYMKESFIGQMITKKFEAFDIDIKLLDPFVMIIDLCTDSNPGVSQLMIKEILENVPDLKPGHTITTWDFLRIHDNKFPRMSYPDINEKYEKLWNAQKKKRTSTYASDNKVDTKEYWLEIFK